MFDAKILITNYGNPIGVIRFKVAVNMADPNSPKKQTNKQTNKK